MDKRDSLLKKPEFYHFDRYGCRAARVVREFRVSGDHGLQSGTVLTAEVVKQGGKVNVAGLSRGRGYQGVMKRHGFKGGKASHGAKTHRKPGSIGNSADPSRVVKGKKMPGHMGHASVTVRNLEVVQVEADRNLVLVKGSVPGHRGGLLRIMPIEEQS